MSRKHNFNPGPATLPLSVLQKVQAEFVDYQGTGMSIVEMSHRSKEFEAILEHAKVSLKQILQIPDTHETIFLGGGASLQFSMIPMNFLENSADYTCTGEWAQRAIKEAKLFGNVNVVASSEQDKFAYIPTDFTFHKKDISYAHITSNNTIYGTQWSKYPDTGSIPLFGDLSSDFLSRKVDVSKFALIYAGAQKNVGPAGVTVVIIKKDLLDKVVANRKIPTMMQYKIHVENNSLYNTPPVFAIYMVDLVLDWIKEIGGLEKIEQINDQKAKLLYDTMDSMPEFYKGTVRKDSRSKMNVPFRLPNEEMEKKFLSEATKRDFVGLKGHRSVGGIRASLYNALSLESVEKLTEFMKEFYKKNK